MSLILFLLVVNSLRMVGTASAGVPNLGYMYPKQGPYAVLKIMEKNLPFSSLEKVWKNFFCSVSIEKENNFSDLIFRHTFS